MPPLATNPFSFSSFLALAELFAWLREIIFVFLAHAVISFS